MVLRYAAKVAKVAPGCCLPLRFSRKIALPRGSIRLGNAGTRPRPRNTRGGVTVCKTRYLSPGGDSLSTRTVLVSRKVVALTSEPVQSPVAIFFFFARAVNAFLA